MAIQDLATEKLTADPKPVQTFKGSIATSYEGLYCGGDVGDFTYGVGARVSDSLVFDTGANFIWRTTSGREQARMDASGNLGLGTMSPGARLDVNGKVMATALEVKGPIMLSGKELQIMALPSPPAGVSTDAVRVGPDGKLYAVKS